MGCVSDANDDPWRLERFVTAQDRGGTYQRAVAELRAGAKVSHWMWFIFPQVAGLGMSAMSREYAISSAQEARAYLPTRCSAPGCASAPASSRTPRAGPPSRSSGTSTP